MRSRGRVLGGLVWRLFSNVGLRLLTVAWAGAICASPLLLGTDRPSDVLGGVLLGIGLVVLVPLVGHVAHGHPGSG